MRNLVCIPLLFTLLTGLVTGPTLAHAETERPGVVRAPAPTVVPPPEMQALDDDQVRPPLPGSAVPTDPRDGTTRERDQAHEILASGRFDRAVVNGYAESGGDDVLFGDLRYIDNVEMDIAENGDIYVALGKNPEDFYEYIEILRSTNGGDSFELIGTIDSADPDYDRLYTLDVIEGNTDRVYITYMHYNTARGGFDMRVAYADIPAASPSWQIRTVMDTAGVSFLGPDLTTDVTSFSGYYLYAVCAGLDGNGDDIWFSRSTDYGNTWSTPYRVSSITSSGNLMYSRPRIAYGSSGRLHLSYVYTERLQSTFDDGVRYRMATNFGAAPADWPATTWALTPTDDGEDCFIQAMVADPITNHIGVLFTGYSSSSPRLFESTNAGDTWSFADLHDVPMIGANDAVIDHAAGRLYVVGFVSGGEETFNRTAYVSTPTSDFSDWNTPLYFGEHSTWFGGRPTIAIDPSRTDGVAFAYTANTASPDYQAAFDAQWRSGEGYPNYEEGFPLAIPSGGSSQRTAPAVVDLDGDGIQEIVFGNVDGTIYVVDVDGTVREGWPVDVGTLGGRTSPVAVGDLNGDGVVEIVAGTADGRVFALAPDGTVRGGFPVDLGTGQATFVAIGAVGPPYPRWIVAVSGNEQARINWRGAVEFKSGTLNGTHNSSPAIGDIDGDGDAEIVYAFTPTAGGGAVQVVNGDLQGGVQMFRAVAEPISDSVSLGDVDLDGDLEITVPTTTGKMYVLHHTGSDVAGFPYTSASGSPLSRAAIDQILGISPPELIFAARNWQVHVVYSTGVEQSSFPASTTTGWYLRGAPIVTSVASTSGNYVVIGSRDQKLWSFRNVGAAPASGWPRSVGDPIEVTPAAGDLDGDGRTEIVFLGNASLHVIDVAVGRSASSEWWTMEGADAARTGCANCDEDIVTAVDGTVTSGTRVALRMMSGNPARGPVEFTFALPARSIVDLEVYDLRGRRVRQVERTELGAGPHQLVFDGRDQSGEELARGSYIARLRVRDVNGTQDALQKFTWMR